MRTAGALFARRNSSAAATISATLEEKLVLANSPSLDPRPVKSKRRTPMPSLVRPCAMRCAACRGRGRAAAERWREERIGARLTRVVEQVGEPFAARGRQIESAGRHLFLLSEAIFDDAVDRNSRG